MSTQFKLPPDLTSLVQNPDLHFVVTGGGGWIGRNILEVLDVALGGIVAQRVRVYGSSDRQICLTSGRALQCLKLSDIKPITDKDTIFFHCAFMTRDRVAGMDLNDYIKGNEAISASVASAVKASKLCGLFVPSSGAVYKKGSHILDSDLQKNPYGVLKIRDEELFAECAASQSAPFCMPRVYNLAGPFINKPEVYALASMITAVQAGQPITIRASNRVVRSYIHVLDLIRLVFAMLLQPQKSDIAIFDTVGAENLEMADLAERIRTTLNAPHLPIQRAIMDPAKLSDVYIGLKGVMDQLMQNHAITPKPFDQQIRDTADYLAKLPLSEAAA